MPRTDFVKYLLEIITLHYNFLRVIIYCVLGAGIKAAYFCEELPTKMKKNFILKFQVKERAGSLKGQGHDIRMG
jgi:hypothetical protein